IGSVEHAGRAIAAVIVLNERDQGGLEAPTLLETDEASLLPEIFLVAFPFFAAGGFWGRFLVIFSGKKPKGPGGGRKESDAQAPALEGEAFDFFNQAFGHFVPLGSGAGEVEVGGAGLIGQLVFGAEIAANREVGDILETFVKGHGPERIRTEGGVGRIDIAGGE